MSELLTEIYGELNKTPFQVLLQLDRYTVKEMDVSKLNIGDVVVAIYDESIPEYPQKDFGRVIEMDNQTVTFIGEVSNQTLTVPRRHVLIPLDYKWSDSVERYVLGAMSIEETYKHQDLDTFKDRMYDSLYKEKIVPGGRVQASMGIYEKYGKQFDLTAYNCYVLPNPKDSRKGIINGSLSEMTEIMSRGGGVGIALSTLRPRNARVYGVNGISSGSVSWGGLLSYATGLIEQGGSRKGALMLQLHISHPDIFDFITIKRESGKITNANLSVQITKEFMEAVENDADWHLIFPDTRHAAYDNDWADKYQDIHDWLEAGLPVEIYQTVKARELYDLIIESAHASAEPGVMVYDHMNDGYMPSTQQLIPLEGTGLYKLDPESLKKKHEATPWNNTYYYQKNVSSNPCGEQPLCGNGICNLIHINLAEFFNKETNDVDWDDLKQAVADAIRYADDVIDYTVYFREENERVQKEQRRIGMGTLGLHDLLIDLELRYGSDESIAFIDRLYAFIKNSAYEASAKLAEVRGRFPKYDEKILEARVPKSLDDDVKALIKKHGLRNSHLLTQAPTGTTGTKTGSEGYSRSTGVEPFFSIKWERESRLGKTIDYLGKAKDYLERTGEKVLPDYFVSAMCVEKDGTPKITPKNHVDVQVAIQKHNDSAISKTCNVPNHFTVEQTKELYSYGIEKGVVGLTIYRDGSRDTQVLRSVSDEEEQVEEVTASPAQAITFEDDDREFTSAKFYKRPTRLVGETIKSATPFGKMYVTVNRHPQTDLIEEVFLNLGKTGADISAIADGLAIALTGLLSPRIANLTQQEKVNWIIKKFNGIKGQSAVGFGKNQIESLPDALAKVLMQLGEDNEAAVDVPESMDKFSSGSVDICPSCGQSTFVKQDGCTTCLTDLGGCGYSKC